MVCNFFGKKTSGSNIENENILNKVSAEELHKSITKKFNKRKIQSPLIENIWATDLADMQLRKKFNDGSKCLSYLIHIYSKFTWVIPLKDKTGIRITNAFQKILKESNHKPNKICVEKSSEFYTSLMRSLLEKMI